MLVGVHWSQIKLTTGVIGKHMAVIEKLSDQSVDEQRKTAVETLLVWETIVTTFRQGWRRKFWKFLAAS